LIAQGYKIFLILQRLQAQSRAGSHTNASASATCPYVPMASIHAAINDVSQRLVKRDTKARILLFAALAWEQMLF
jgi:hypothetical protein